jgi:hypothetical protein
MCSSNMLGIPIGEKAETTAGRVADDYAAIAARMLEIEREEAALRATADSGAAALCGSYATFARFRQMAEQLTAGTGNVDVGLAAVLTPKVQEVVVTNDGRWTVAGVITDSTEVWR